MRCLSRSPSSQPPVPLLPNPPLFTAGNQGRGPLPAGVVPTRLHKLALIGAGETCSKGGSEGQKAAKAKRKGEARSAAWCQTGDPAKVTFLCRPIVSLLRLTFRSEARLLVLPLTASEEAVRSETVAAEVLPLNESWMRLCEHC